VAGSAGEAAGSRRGRFRDALRHRDFRRLIGATLVDSTGTWSYAVVLVGYVFALTHSATDVAVLVAVKQLPVLLLSGLGGVLADRFPRIRVMVWSAVASCLVMTGITAAVALHASAPLVIVLSGLASCAAVPYRPAAGSLTPDLVGEADLAPAVALVNVVQNVVVIAGPGIGAVLLLIGQPAVGCGINAASFLVAAAVVARIHLPGTPVETPAGRRRVLSELAAGCRVVLGSPVLAALLVCYALDTVVAGAAVVFLAPVSRLLGSGSSGYGYLLMAEALGAVLAAGLANRLSGRRRLAPVIAAGLVVQAAPLAGYLVARSPVEGFFIQLVSGAGMVVVDVVAVTTLQRNTPRQLLGRVMGLALTALIAAQIAGSLVIGPIVQSVGVPDALAGVAIVVPAIGLAVCWPILRADRRLAAETSLIGERAAVLGHLDLFTGAGEPVLEQLAATASEVGLPAGAPLLVEGDPSDDLYVLVSGRLAVSAGDRPLPDVQAPGYVGELGLLHATPRTATVRAAEDSRLWRIPGADFLQALSSAESSPSLLAVADARLTRTPRAGTHLRRPVAVPSPRATGPSTRDGSNR
jgi:MFS family permease